MSKPHLYVFDEGGGFRASLQETMGPGEVTRAVNCERHGGFSVERRAKKLKMYVKNIFSCVTQFSKHHL